MKKNNGQRMFAGAVASALVRAWTERLGLRVVVDPREGTSTAELVDDTGRVVWSQAAAGAQLELPLRAVAAPPPPSRLVRIAVPADASLHPDNWADDHDLTFFAAGLVRWEMDRTASRAEGAAEDTPATAWTVVPRTVGAEIAECLAGVGLPVVPTDASADDEVMLLAEGGEVSVRSETWRVELIDGPVTTLVSPTGERRDVNTSDVRWIGGFCCVAPLAEKAKAPKAKAKAPKAKAKAPKPTATTRLWIAEEAWDALRPDDREAFAAHDVEWQGARGYVFADVPHGGPLLAVRNLAQKLGVAAQDHTPEGL